MPGVLWLLLFFLAPMYVVLAIVFGQVDPIFRTPVPVVNPLQWDPTQFTYVLSRIGPGGAYGPALIPHRDLRADRQRAVPADRLPRCLLRGQAVGTVGGHPAGCAHRAVLDQLHDANVGLGQPASGRRAGEPDCQHGRVVRRARALLTGQPVVVVLGLVYGYVPYMILPHYAGLDRLPQATLGPRVTSAPTGWNRSGG